MNDAPPLDEASAPAGATPRLFEDYGPVAGYDEMFEGAGVPRAHYEKVFAKFSELSAADLDERTRLADLSFLLQGITFAVYGSQEAGERLIPFDIIPRILSAAEWRRLSAGIEQRVRALNAFMYDVYHRQEILRAGRIPEDLVIQNEAFLPEMVNVEPPRGARAVTGALQ